MHVILQGSLEHFAAKKLLLFLAGVQEGTLDAESGGARLRIALRDGHIVAAEGNGDAFGVVAKLLGSSDGTFTFLDEVVLPEGASPLALDVAAVIAGAEERIAIAGLYPDENITFRVINRPPGEISLTAEEFQLLFQIGTGKSLGQLRMENGRAAVDLYPTVKRLQVTGLIEVVSDSGATARGTTLVPSLPAPPPAPSSAPLPASQKTMEQQEPALIATLTADDGTMHPLLEETSTIGRTPANAIALRDGSVSASHARVERTAGGFVIEDVGSRNGTYVNSEKLSGKRLLADGDLLRLGKIILTFNLAADLKRKQSTEREMMK
jgi:pSer/pThr/pTyr-binding forkhead associated (FHA) protein